MFWTYGDWKANGEDTFAIHAPKMWVNTYLNKSASTGKRLGRAQRQLCMVLEFAEGILAYQKLWLDKSRTRQKVLDSIKMTHERNLTSQIGEEIMIARIYDPASRLMAIAHTMLELHFGVPNKASFRYEAEAHIIRVVAAPGLDKVRYACC